MNIMDRRSRSPSKKRVVGVAPGPNRLKKGSVEEARARQVTHAFKEFVAHNSNVNCLTLGRKSGRVLATGGDDKKVNLWAVGKPNCILSLSGHSTAVECVRFGASEELVCAGSYSGALKIWDLLATKMVRTLTGHKANIRAIDFHPYGEFICTGSLDTNIKLWDIRRKGCIFTYKGHNLSVNSLKFSPDGQWIASGGEDHAVKLWDLRQGKLLIELGKHRNSVNEIEFHPHEFLLASASDDRTVNVWDLERFSQVSSTDADCGPIRTIAFHPSGECVYGGATDVLKVFDWEPSRTLDTVAMGWGKVQDIAVAQNQLIGATSHGVYVSLFVIDLKRVQPYGGPEREAKVPGRPDAPLRKNFVKDRNSGKANCDSIKRESNEVFFDDSPDDDCDFFEITNQLDYVNIFGTARELQRTPPPFCSNNNGTNSSKTLKTEEINSRLTNSETRKVFTPETLRKSSQSTPKATIYRFDGNSNNSSSSNKTFSIQNHSNNERRTSVGSALNSSSSRENSSSSSSYGTPPQSLFRGRTSSESRRENPSVVQSVSGQFQYFNSTASTPDQREQLLQHSPSEPRIIASQPTENYSQNSLSQYNHVEQSQYVSRTDRNRLSFSRGSHSADTDNVNKGSYSPSIQRSNTANCTNLYSNENKVSYKPVFSQIVSANQRLAQNFTTKQPITNQQKMPSSQDIPVSYLGALKQPEHSSFKSDFSGYRPDLLGFSADMIPDKLKSDYESGYLSSSPQKFDLNMDEFLPVAKFGSALTFGNEKDAITSLTGMSGAFGNEKCPITSLTGMSGAELSEQEVMSSVVRGHSTLRTILMARARVLQQTQKVWQSKDLKSAVEHALRSGDQALVVDFLSVLNFRSSIWNLDILTLLLPAVSLLLQSRHESYVNCGSDALKLMIRNFAPMIKSNMQGPVHSVGIDISREERKNKCIECYNHMISIKACLLKRQTVPGKLGHMYRELAILMQCFD